MNCTWRWSMVFAAAFLLHGCYYYPQPVAVAVPGSTPAQRFERSWNAAAAAMADQGATITSEDRGAGVIRGTRGSIAVVATLQTLPDGSIQVKFSTSGATDADPQLIHRVSDSYDRRMGR
jgi:hypothetical protein